MKKLLKITMQVLPVIIMIAIVIMPTLIADQAGGINITDKPEMATGTTTTMISKVWGVIRTSLQVASLAAFIFAGVKYMFASADQKADLKKSLSILVVGALLVFASTTVVEVLIKIFKDLTNTTT